MGPVSGHPGILSGEALELPTNAELHLSSDSLGLAILCVLQGLCRGISSVQEDRHPALYSEANFRERVAVCSLALCYVLVLISA